MKALKTRGMDSAHLRDLTPEDLATRIADLERERFNLRFRGATQALDDPLRLRVIRRDLARLKTVQRAKGAARTGGK